MPFDVQEEITDIRERLARIETTLASLNNCVRKETGGHNIVIPVAAVVAVAEVARILLERFA